jgi:hypothetical protein
MSKGGEQRQESQSEQRHVATASTRLPESLERASAQDLALANEIGRIGYVPYMGPTVAAMSPSQLAAISNTNAAAGAFGLAQSPTPQMPQAAGKGGVAGGMGAGFSPFDLYMQAIQALPPGQRGAIESYLINPQTGALPTRSDPQVNTRARR